MRRASSERAERQHWTSRRCSPTRCGRSSRRSDSRGRVEDTLSRGHPGRRRGALRLGRRALRERARALRDPRNWVRPVVAVGAGGVATGALVLFEMRRRRRSARRRRALREPATSRPATSSESAVTRGAGLRLPESAGWRRPAPSPMHAEDQVEEVVLGVDRDEVEQDPDPFVGLDESPDREHEVDGADAERVRRAPQTSRRPRARSGRQDVDDVVPAVDREDAEDLVGVQRLGAGREARA